MERNFRKVCLGIFSLTLFLMSMGIAFAANFSDSIKTSHFSASLRTDRQTQINAQYCEIKVTDTYDSNQSLSKQDDFTSYSRDTTETWNTKIVKTTRDDVAYYSIINNQSSLGFSWFGTTYNPYRGNAKSLELSHFSLPNYNGFGTHYATAKYVFNAASIGEISFDALILLNATTPASSSIPKARFTAKLGHDVMNQSESIEMFFETKGHAAENNYTVNAYYNAINPSTGQKSEKTQLFQSQIGNFNWINVKVFFDAYNDVYNITMQQYRPDEGFLGSPVSTVIRGQQYNSSSWTRAYSGTRISTTQLINSFSLLLESNAISSRSSVFIDNFQANVFRFPAVYADVIHDNATIEKKSYMNRTAISALNPPKYPSNTILLANPESYAANAEPNDVYTSWQLAPSWIYSFPLILSPTDHEMNVRTLLKYINDKQTPIEKMGIMEPDQIGYYETGMMGGPLSSQNFTYSENDSKPFDYWFKSESSKNIIRIEYDSEKNVGQIRKIGIYPESITNEARAIFMVDFVDVAGQINDIDGFPMLMFFTAIGIIWMIKFVKKQKLTNL